MRSAVVTQLVLAAQLVLLSLLVAQTRVVSPAFVSTFPVIVAGAFLQGFLPEAYRRPFFLTLSLAIVVLLFGPLAAVALLAAGSLLIGICHLRLPLWTRIVLLLAVGTLLVLYRLGHTALPALPRDVALMIPVLASMFMFRLSIYLYDRESGNDQGTLIDRLSYFFMLPNALFLLFPIVDYTTMQESYKPDERTRIQREGIVWIVEGVVHLLLVRAVQMWVMRDPGHLETRLDSVLYILSAYLFVLRVSGQFHIIVGILKLFGFDLPRTNIRYFLASSFTDVWRRSNIYWKDYITKMFYFPCVSRLRRLGPVRAAMLAASVVFFATIVLHAYQFFWLTGSFEIRSRDLLYWVLLGVFVMINMYLELTRTKVRSLRPKKPTGADLAKRVLKTAATFLAMTVLWSLWSTDLPLDAWLDILVGVVK